MIKEDKNLLSSTLLVPLGAHSQALAIPKSWIVGSYQSLLRERFCCPLSHKHSSLTLIRYRLKLACLSHFIWFWDRAEQQVFCRGKLWAPLVYQSGRSFPTSPQRAEQYPKSNPFNEPQRTQMGLWTFLISPDTLKLICVEYEQQQCGEGNTKPQQMNYFYAFPPVLSLLNIFKLNHSPSQWNDCLKSAWLFQHYLLCKLPVLFYFRAMKT